MHRATLAALSLLFLLFCFDSKAQVINISVSGASEGTATCKDGDNLCIQIGSFEDILDRTLMTGNLGFTWLHPSASGFYLPDYGVVVTMRCSIFEPADVLPQLLPTQESRVRLESIERELDRTHKDLSETVQRLSTRLQAHSVSIHSDSQQAETDEDSGEHRSVEEHTFVFAHPPARLSARNRLSQVEFVKARNRRVDVLTRMMTETLANFAGIFTSLKPEERITLVIELSDPLSTLYASSIDEPLIIRTTRGTVDRYRARELDFDGFVTAVEVIAPHETALLELQERQEGAVEPAAGLLVIVDEADPEN